MSLDQFRQRLKIKKNMESTIRIEYSGIHDGMNSEDKRPIIKIETKQSDDARDSLLCDLITPSVQIGLREYKTNTYVLYAKSRHQQVYEIAESTYQVLIKLPDALNSIALVTGSNDIYFEDTESHDSATTKYKCSSTLNRDETIFMKDDEIKSYLVKVFIEFNDSLKLA